MLLLDKIERLDTGRNIIPTRPLPTVAIKDVEKSNTYDTFYPDILIRYELRLGCNVVVPGDMRKDPEYEIHDRRKVTRMIAETLYSEVVRDLQEIMIYSYENLCDRKLDEMCSDLIRKMRP